MARLVLEAASPVEMRRRFHYLLVILRHDRERIRAYADELERHEAALARLDEEEEALRALRAQLEAKQRALGDRDSERAALTQRLRSERGLAVRAALETQQAREDLTKQMVRLDVPAATPPSARASGTETSSPSSLFRASYGRLPWPLKGRIQRAFGPYKDEMTGVEGRNNGLDIEAPLGTPFRAVFDGRVSKAGYLRGYGQTVVVEHGAWTSVYAHANGISVGPGQEVLQGEVLGHVGNSGLLDAGAPRLHFEIRFNATPQDPSPWFGKVADR
jgi:septal ring factor EnvC (AmiA/AmiB activator)